VPNVFFIVYQTTEKQSNSIEKEVEKKRLMGYTNLI
jgi:hypothetical protein